MRSAPVTNRIRGLYAITPDSIDGPTLSARVDELVGAGVRLFQYRRKSLAIDEQQRELEGLMRRHPPVDACWIVNDNAALAHAVGAAGVHLGQADAPADPAQLKAFISSIKSQAKLRGRADFVVGVSCYADLDRAIAAEAAGADYVAFGSCFASATKPNAPLLPRAILALAKTRLSIPVVAIGGITRDNAAGIVAAGADSIAVISEVFLSHPQMQCGARARTLMQLFVAPHSPSQH
jgi:thiamine-phosphate pyrophosphorylase